MKRRFVVSAPIGGVVSRPELRPGDLVKAGDALVTLAPSEPPLLDARTRADLSRERKLGDSSTAAALEAAELKVRTAEQQLASAKIGVQAARFQEEAARAALARAEGRGADAGTSLRAPVDGRVLRVLLDDGGVVLAGRGIFEIGDPHDLEIVIDLLSTDAVNVRPGAAVRVERWGGAGVLPAAVRSVEPAGFTKVSALGIEEQRVNVIADFEGPPEARAALGDGYRVGARVVVAALPDVVRVPLSALFRSGDAWAVFTLSSGKARLTEVTLGQRNDRFAEVKDGLSEGARVVLHPGDRLRDGAPLEPEGRAPAAALTSLAAR